MKGWGLSLFAENPGFQGNAPNRQHKPSGNSSLPLDHKIQSRVQSLLDDRLSIGSRSQSSCAEFWRGRTQNHGGLQFAVGWITVMTGILPSRTSRTSHRV